MKTQKLLLHFGRTSKANFSLCENKHNHQRQWCRPLIIFYPFFLEY